VRQGRDRDPCRFQEAEAELHQGRDQVPCRYPEEAERRELHPRPEAEAERRPGRGQGPCRCPEAEPVVPVSTAAAFRELPGQPAARTEQ
jgi:hypothetical protein